jgi:hypothetical protein
MTELGQKLTVHAKPPSLLPAVNLLAERARR